MKLKLLNSKEITEFEKEIGYELVVHERPSYLNLDRFYVSFEHGEVMENGCLIGASGNGNTIDEAIIDYCNQISNRKMAFNAYQENRKEIRCPKLVHTVKTKCV